VGSAVTTSGWKSPAGGGVAKLLLMLVSNIIAPLLSRWNAYVEVLQNPTGAKLYAKAPFPVSAIRGGVEVKV
jgi:hypothetical protein